MAEDKVTNLYNAFVKSGYAMEPETQFRENLKDPKKRKAAYDALVADGYSMESFADFESNIGFGAPAPTTPASQQQAQPATTAAPTSVPASATAEEQEQAPAQSQLEQPAWQPSEQDKIRMSYQMNTMLNDFNQRSRARLKQIHRLTEPFSPNGRLTTSLFDTYSARRTRATSINAQIKQAETELAGLQKQYEDSKSRVHEELAEDYKKNTAPLAAVFASHTYVSRQQTDKENSALRVAIRQKEEQIKDLIEERDRQSGKDVGFWRGFGRTVSDFRTWDFGMNDLSDAMTMLNAERYFSPNATEGERKAGEAMMKAIYDKQETENLYSGNASWWNRAGGMTGHMPAFMLDFAFTGGGYGSIAKVGANTAVKQSVKIFGKKAIEEMAELGVKGYAKKYGVRGVGKMAGNWTVKALGTTADDLLVRAPLMTNTIQGGKTAADIIDRKFGDVVIDKNGNYDFSNDKTWGSAIWQGEANSIIENYSEMFGSHIDSLTPMLAKTFGSKRISGMLARANASGLGQILDTTRKQLQHLGVSDFFGEVSEEYYGQLWRTMLNLDDAYTNVLVFDAHGNPMIDEHGDPVTERKNLLFTSQFHGDIWGGMALSMGLIGAGKYTLTGVGYANMKREVNKADRTASQILNHDEWETLRETIDNTTNEDMGALAENIINDSKLSEEERAVVMEYMERSLNLRGLNLATLAQNRGAETDEPVTLEDVYLPDHHTDGETSSHFTPEQADAQQLYSKGSELYGRFEEGDPTVQADVDAIALRMKEAYQAVEDAFGSEAEYYMFHVNENPWALVNDPELTAEQQDAVLYCINAKAALDGVMDASNDAADRKRAEVEQSVAKRTHKDKDGKDDGMIISAETKMGKQVYIVMGDVVMFPDNKGVDRQNSSSQIWVLNPESGEYEPSAPEFIERVIETVSAQDELDTALSVIEQEQMSVFGENAIAPEEPAEGEAPIDQSADVSPEPAPETANTEEYDRDYEQGLEEAAKADDAWIANLIKIYSQNTPESIPKTMKGRLDAFLYEQQRRAQSVPENAESVPNPTENVISDAEITPETVSSVENGQQTALSRIPTNEQGEPIFEAVDKDTAWDGLVEAVGSETDAVDIAMAQVQQASTDLEALKKKPPTQKAPKLKGSPMAMAQAKRDAAEQYQRDLAQYNQQIADTEARLAAWNGIVSVYTSRNAELRRQQEEERRQRDYGAVARFDEEQRINAELEAIMGKVEREQQSIFKKESGFPAKESVPLQRTLDSYGDRFEQDSDAYRRADSSGMAADSTGDVAEDRDRSDIRVYETGLAVEPDAYSGGSERDRRDAESERLVAVARSNGQYIPRAAYSQYGELLNKRSGESVVYDNRDVDGRVYKVKNPYAKSPMKGNVQPEDAIFEHLVHNKYFPETSYRFEGISDEIGDVRIVLSQSYIESVGQPTKEQVEAALALKGLYPEGLYSYGNEEVSVTDVAGDNALLGVDGNVYFIDPIINFKKPVKDILDGSNGIAKSEPTEAQKKAGNYKMEHRRVDGYNISIENAKGSVRRGIGAGGKQWETVMQNDYGYIRGTEGVDGDHIDVFLSDTPEEGDVFVIDQVNEDGSFDEHKVMYGFPSEETARDAYLSNYEQGWTGLGAITHVSKEEFKKWIGSSKRKTKPFANYKSVKPKEDNSMVGRSLSEQEVTDLIAKMEANAEVAPAIELTPENWIAQFGEDGTVKTPIGIVKMGANQLLKLYSLKRTEYFGMIHPTLNSPDVILEEADPKEGSERDSKYLFIKTFVKSDGTRIVHFESVTVKKDGMEVSISSHEIKDKSLKNKMQNDIVLHLDEKLSPSSEMRLTETPSESEGPDLVPTSDNVSSDGKDNTLSADKQTDGAESSEPYTITPTSYTNKKGKTSDVHLVKFNRELTKEEKTALDTFVREPLAECKKTSRGWYDRKQGGYMMRSEEAARQLGEMLGNEEAVADVQPMTAEELREAVAPATPAGKKPAKSKKSPINRVSLEDVMTDLSTKGETKLSDHAEPVKKEPETQHEISDDEMQSLANELRELLGIGEDEGDADIKFRDPGELTPQERQRIRSAGIRLAMGLVERDTTSFPDYATKMVGLLGDKIRPWLKSFYEGARWTPGYEKYAFTPTEQVAVFDVQNFDKKQADPIAQAAMIVEERKAATASEQAQKELIETRNKNRRENDKQREADTAALAEKAEAVAGEAEVTAQSAGTGEAGRKRILRDLKRVDDTLDEVNDQLAILGYYEAEEVDKDFNEAYGYMRNAEKKAVKDAVELAKQLVNDLGLGLDKVTGSTTANRGKRKNAVTANIAPAGGDISIRLPLNEGRELYITIGLDPSVTPGDVTYSGDNLQATRIMYRVEWPDEKGHVSFDRMGRNCWADANVTYADLLKGIQREAKEYLPSSTPAEAEETHNGYKIGDEVMWDRYGNGNWEKVKIEDFDTDGGPIFEAVKGVMSEKGDWSRVKPADGIFGEAKRVARATQEKKRSSRKKDVTLKPEQPFGDLFGGLFDNTQSLSNHEETEMGTRPGEAGRQRQQLKQDTQVGGDEPRRETERPAGEAGSGSTGMDSDADRAGSRGLHDVATQPALERLPEKERKNVHNNHVERGTEVAPKSESARIKANIAAIETMKKLEASGEAPTAADMKKLRAFSGWGGLGKAFSDWDTSRQLRQLLGDKLYDEGAEMSRNSAYFTPAYIVDAMWDIARAMGFKGGRVLEGSAGIGNVLGLMPQDLSERSYIRAVEKDPTTGKMLSLLYPDAVVDIDGFEKVKIETGTYDLVITNVPFVPGLKVADTSGDGDISKEFKTSIHDFCIAKNVRKLRDGGVGVFITTAGSMDGTGRLHKWLSNRENADIVGMFRMHNETFGGTNATSDIIVVRKRVNGVKSPNAIDCSLTTGVRTAEYDTGEKKKVKNVGEVPIIKTLSMSYNRYYVEHPEYMAGEMHFGFEKGDTSFRPESKGLYPIKEKDQSQLLSQWVEDMKQKLADTSEEPAPTVMNHRDEYVPTYDKVGNEVKTGTVVVDSQGRICVNYDGTARPLMSKLDNKNPKSADERIAQFNKNKVKGRSRVQVVQDYNAIKKALNDLLEYQKTSDSDEGLQPKLKALNRAFDSFVATYGHLHGNNGLAWLKNDVDYPSVIALETYREEGLEHKKVFGKADIFSRRVVVRPEQPKATNVRDGVTLSIRQTGSLDTRYIAEQLGMSEADVRREVIEAGLGYENPLTHSMEAAHEYLSGNVREKMQQAEVNNEDGRYTPNITALRKVVPHNIPSHFIEFSIGSSWLRPELFEQYVKERTGASVKLTYAGGMWAMDKPKWTGEQDKLFGIRSEICYKIITGTELIEAAMTNRTIRVSKQQKDGPTISDPKATSACAAKVDEIRDDFKSWLRSRMESAPELAKEIEETYNNIFNNSAPMTIPDEYIPEYFDGAARVIGGKPIKMRKHQSKAIVRGTMQSLMLAHEVGTGKTFTLITTAMEMRRLGTAKKPMIVVQNATLGQFVASAKALYPDARILSLEDKDRNAEGRKDFYAKIRYNDWDMVVIPQSVLERIPDHPDRERRFIEESIQEKMDVIEAMSKDREAGRAVAALKKDVENLRDQLNKLSDTETAEGEVTERVMVTSGSKPKKDGKRAAIAKENAKTRAEEMLNRATDDTLNFDDLGVDAILVDEAHEYKHLGFATAMQRGVKGVDPSYSKKCQGLYLKVKAVQEKSGGRNVIFATGTPISNTAAEVWTFMRYLLPREVMEGHNIWHFDDFVRNFGSIQQMLEFTTQGTYKENNRFAGYSNLPELARIWAGITDTVLTAEAGEVKSQIPELEGGQPTDLYLPQTNGLRAVLKFVRAQLKAYDEMSGQEKKENSHIPLVMYGIAKAAAIDARLVMANAPDDPHSKTNEAVRQTLRSLEDSKAYNGTVAIFADNYQRKNKGTGAVEFNLFDDIRTKLIAQGVPAEQVVIMRDGMTDKAKEKIFAKVNAGEIRVILGTTQRLGVGVNIQERLHTLMHIDAPNRPMDYWQRMGRLLRQGNMHKEMGIPVRVIRFGVEDSLDVTAYQRLKTKGAIADAIMHSRDLLANNLENRILEEEGDEFGNITAELSGSQYAMLQNQTEKELRKLQAKQDQHRQHQMYIHRAEPRLREQIEKFGNDIMRSNEILALLENNPTTITINGKTYQSREDMQKVFEAHNKAMAAKKQSVQQDEPITSTLTFDIGNVHFTLTTHVSQIAGYGGQGPLSFDVYVQHDVVSHDIDYKRSFGDIPLKRIINELVDSVTSGKEERSNREAWVNAKERNETDLAALLKDKGKPFEHGERIKELEQKLEEYTIAMQEELKEKEAKYAEMDANIEDATDITFTSEDDEDSEDTPTNGDGNKYRDGEMSDGERLRAIRALVPVAVERNNMSRAELFAEYRTLPDVAKDGINIQFLRTAFGKNYKEGGLFAQVVPQLDALLEGSILAYSEKDSLGGMQRPDGTEHKAHPNVISFDNYVNKALIADKEYYVRMTVQKTRDNTTGLHSCFVSNVDIYEKTATSETDSAIVRRPNQPYDGITDAKLQKFFERASSEELELDKADRVMELSERLGMGVRVISDQSGIDRLPSARHRRAKGYFDTSTGEVVIVIPNNRDVADVDNTFVHEVVGHKGLRAFIGEERFDEFLGEVYNHASNPIRKVIDKKTDDMVNAEADRLRVHKAKARERAGEDVNSSYYADMAEARVEAEAKREEFRKEATEEYMSDLGGRIGSEGFEKMSRDELTLWGKIKAKVQSFLDKFLRGLKIAKSIRLNDKDLSYILYKSWKNLRDKQGKGDVFAEAEDVVMRRRTGYDAEDVTRFRDPGLGLEETITKMKAEALQANTDNLQAKRDAMRAIGGNLNHLRQAMARQREYDITTVKSVADLARILMDANLLDDLSKYETKRILGAINNVVGKQDVSRYVQKVMDIMVDNQLRMGANTLGRLLSIRGSHVDARGIEVQGELDPDGQRIAQVVRKATSLPKDNIDNRIAETINRMSSTDQAIADDATIEYAGLQIARQYVEDITESKAEEKALRDSIKQAKEDKDAGQMTEEAYRQYVASTEDAIRQNKIERAEAFHSLVEQVGGVLNESVERAKAWREAEKQRVEEIHHNANSDMEGRPTDEHHKDDRTQKLANNSGVRFLLAPLATFDQMLRMFGKKNTRGEGYLWNRYMRGWVSATEKEYTGYRDALKVLDAKVSEIYGKDMKWGDLFSIDRKLPKASVRFFDGGVMKDHELTQGNLLYIYMADKMSDGRMKLRRMGITEEDIEDIKNFLDPKFIQLADWMQEEFLVDKRNEYNEVHKRMFGASMAAIENYFPLKILANARLENVDVADDTTDTALPATSTGSIIKRRRNNLALDVTGANAFSVILDHLQQMERWAAFAEFNRDLNTLLSYKRFRNQVMNMSSVYGGGKTLWNNFRNVCSMAAGAYRPPIADLDKSAVNIAKGVTAAKVSFRVFTALKQFLSMPAYISDSNPMYLAANIANPIGSWRWSMKNLPLFEKRWSSRMAGDPRLLKSDMDWKMWRSHIVEIASRVGMSPNAFVDALTVAIGSHSMYQTKLAKYKRQGYDPDVAEARAKQDATILFNQTQQSSEGAFLSTMQVDRSWLSVLFTVFRNSSMSYTRQLYDSIRNLGHRFTPGYKGLSEEFMAKQMRRDGIDPDKADRNAKQEYRRGIIRDLVRVGVFGYVLQLAWNLGAYLPYLILGEDDEEKDKMWQDVWNHSMFGSIEGLTGGDVISAAGNMWVSGEGNPQYLTKDMPLASDVISILKKMDKDQVSAMNDVVNLLVQSTVGVNPQSLTDAVVAVMDYCGDDAETSRECALLMARVLNCPQSQLDKIYFDELDASGEEASQMTPSEIAERYARYKVRRGAPLTGWAYDNEQREKLMDKYRDRSNTLAKERLTRETDKQASQNMAQWLEEFEATKDRVKEIRKVKSRDEGQYDELLNELEITPEYDRYEIIKGYKRDVDALTKEWLNATTPAQRDSCAQAIIRLKSDMVRELINTQQ